MIFFTHRPGADSWTNEGLPASGKSFCGSAGEGGESPGAAPPPRPTTPTTLEDGALRRRLSHARRLDGHPSWDPELDARARGAFAPPRRPPRESRAVSAGRPSGREVEQKVPRARANISRMDYPTDSPLGSPDGDEHRRSLFGGDVGGSDAFAIHEPSSLFGAARARRATATPRTRTPSGTRPSGLCGAGAGPSVGTRGGDSAFSASPRRGGSSRDVLRGR